MKKVVLGQALMLPLEQALVPFDYSSMSNSIREQAEGLAHDLHFFERESLLHIIKFGMQLHELQSELPRGQFLAWIEAATPISKSTAYRFMDTARVFDERQLPTVGKLELTVAYELAAQSTPQVVRDEVVRRVEAGEHLETDEIKNLISVARDAERQAKADAKLTEEERKRKLQREQRRKKSQEVRKSELKEATREREERQQRKRTAAENAVALIEQRLESNDMIRLAKLVEESGSWDFGNVLKARVGLLG